MLYILTAVLADEPKAGCRLLILTRARSREQVFVELPAIAGRYLQKDFNIHLSSNGEFAVQTWPV